MPEQIRALVVVLVIAVGVFYAAKPIVLRFTSARDFRIRRNLWIVLTIVAFVSPSYWLYVAVAAPLCFWAGRKDNNPAALFIFLMQVAPATVALPLPFPGIDHLFDLDNYRLLTLVIMIPAALRLKRTAAGPENSKIDLATLLLLGFGVLQTLFFVQPDLPTHIPLADSATNFARRAFLFYLDSYVLYIVVRKSCASYEALLDMQAALCLSGVIMATLAMFEAARHWLLYGAISSQWLGHGFSYLTRGGSLRALVSTGQTLSLGYLIALAWGMWLFLSQFVKQKWARLIVPLLLAGGLLASYSRGPMLGAACIFLVAKLLDSRPVANLLKALLGGALFAGVAAVTPLGDRIARIFPFFGGSVDLGNITYRERLAARGWDIIQQHPFFGDQLANFELTDLRQGEGIIDFVNTYVEITVFYGFIGSVLLFGFMVLASLRAYKSARVIAAQDPATARLGINLVACILGSAVMLYTASFLGTYSTFYFILAGLAMGYAALKSAGSRFLSLAEGPGHARAPLGQPLGEPAVLHRRA